jgi:F-type H+-transporting ATPase subunit b
MQIINFFKDHIHPNIDLISINETAIVQLVSFLLFLFIINRVMFRPLRKAVGERDSYIEKIKQDIIADENEVEKISNQLDEKKSAVRDEAFEFYKELEESGGKQAAEILTAAKQEIASLKEKAEKEINAQISEARKKLIKETDIFVVNIMEQVLNRRLVP